ncbi:ArpU family phage packaging/lysis transcriptional regulator [Mangrovibacillus cuniculi]|uniref:ArpU family transcriptional regulator n=1 Tax=Mangrovibacillus cuniculi TaxID=2593652 RepID=A0A7S8CBU9_9BACI|nr:ArpU family phage packaging/lysis transcriptional regulator [Mangrovibacillus cuniculi]QPC47125.1 ArpU family transcriptional regulator [Mangrovibacillus cuniculi]
MEQLQFKLPEIDREITRAAVEAALEKYRFYLLTVPDERLPKVTTTFSLVPPTLTYAFHSSTEEVAIARVDFERERDAYIEKIRRAVNRLNGREREVIIRKYLQEDCIYDYEVYNEMGLSERSYYRIKGETLLRLAFILRVEQYITAN